MTASLPAREQIAAPTAPSTSMVCVVIVTHDSAGVIEQCLLSVEGSFEGAQLADVIVVDNASTDGTLAMVAQRWPHVRVIQSGANIGYAAAVNLGVQAASDGADVLVLNPDTRLRPGSVAALTAALRLPGVGLAVPRLVHHDGRLQPSLRREPSLRTAVGEAALGGRRAGRIEGWGEVVLDPGRYEVPGFVDWACGAVVLISRDCLQAVGEWDESFLLYSEETDYCLRARDSGFGTWYVPAAVVEHRGGDAATSPLLWSLVTSNRARLFSGRHGRLSSAGYRSVLTIGEAVRVLAGQRRARAGLRVLLRPSTRPVVLPP